MDIETRCRPVSLALVLAALGCAAPPASASRSALDAPVEGAPSWAERVALVYINRARADPATELADCSLCADRECYTPAPPVGWNHALGRSARFHSSMLASWGRGLLHSSPCSLRPDAATSFEPEGSCDGSPACACEGGAVSCTDPVACATCTDCTPFYERVGMFGGSPAAENIAFAGSPLLAMNAFLTEPYDVSTCGYGTDSHHRPNGHRYSILSAGHAAVGVGVAGAYMTQDFGWGEPPRGLVAGVHTPELGPDVEVRANWYDDLAPTDVRVNVDGTCNAMSVERGSASNGTYLATITVGSGCVHYVIEAMHADGTVRTEPSAGSYGIGCADDWSSARPGACGCAPVCAGRTCGDDGCGGSCGSCGSGETCSVGGTCEHPAPDAGFVTTDSGTTSPRDAGRGTILADGGRTSSDAASDDAIVPYSRRRGLHSTCSAQPGRSSCTGATVGWLVVLALVVLGRRARSTPAIAALLLGACASGGVARRTFILDSGSESDAPIVPMPDAARVGPADAYVPRPDATAADAGTDARPSDAYVARDAGLDAPGSACVFRTVLDLPGEVFTVEASASERRIPFLAPGEGFYCARVSFTMETRDTLAATAATYDGCPTHSHVAAIEGSTSEGRELGAAYFRMLGLDCARRTPAALELDAWGDPGRSALADSTAWIPAATYRITLTIVPFVTTISVTDLAGTPLGSPVAVDISGSTVAMTRDPVVSLGLPTPVDAAFFPFYGATYSDLRIEADVAPADVGMP